MGLRWERRGARKLAFDHLGRLVRIETPLGSVGEPVSEQLKSETAQHPDRRLRCLWVAGDCPWPPHSGTAKYSSGMLRATAAAGVDVTVLCLSRPAGQGAPGDEPWLGVTWRFVQGGRRPRFRSLLSGLPAMAYSLRTPAFSEALRETLLLATVHEPWDALVIDHLQSGWIVNELQGGESRGTLRVIFLSQNCESKVRRGLTEMRRGPKRLVLHWDGRKVCRLERQVLRAASATTATTSQDLKELKRLVPEAEVLVISPGYDGACLEHREITGAVPRRAVVVGTFDWHVKTENLRRLLLVADPAFASAGVELRVVGSVPESLKRDLSDLKATHFVGVVPSLRDELAQARIGIVAERFGGGFKMKALDYVFHRVPVAALVDNLSGIPLSDADCLVFPDEAALVRGVLEVIDNLAMLESLQRRAYEACQHRFSWSERGTMMRELITSGRPPAQSS